MQVFAADNVFSFFYDRVQDARKVQGTEVEEETEFYLVNLLVDFLQTRRLVEVEGRRVDDRPLAIRLLECKNKDGRGNSFLHLKHLADSTLYVLGFFSESFRRSTVDLRYYRGVGETAYRDLAFMTSWGRTEGPEAIFDEISTKFADCVDLLATVKESTPNHSELVALYERYMETGCERAERRLRACGLLPDEPGETGTVH